MTSEEEEEDSYHSAQADISKLNSRSSNEDNEIIPDSAAYSSSESDNETSFHNVISFNDEIQLSDSSEDQTDPDAPSAKHSNDNDDDMDLPLSKRIRKPPTVVTTGAKLDRSHIRSNPVNSFQLVQESDLNKLGADSERLKTWSSLQSMIQQQSPAEERMTSVTELVRNKKNDLFENLANKDTIKKNLVDLIINETISNKYHDWHFIKYNCAKKINTSNINSLMETIGCVHNCHDEYKFVIEDKDLDRYDSYCIMFPVKYILDAVYDLIQSSSLTSYEDGSQMFKFIICLLLDKKIYESPDIYDKNWSYIIADLVKRQYVSRPLDYITQLEEIFTGLDEKLYFILYRLCSILPMIKPMLMEHYFKKDPQNLIDKFNTMLDERKYEKLLYFIMFVYGSSLLPFEQDESATNEDIKTKLDTNKTHLYFTDCIYDLAQTTTSEVEVSLIKSLLNIYSKII
ncbi:hypothetical protein C6P45_003019 [Maudiozyma exigua]|uniref:Uncharacterized protein n=1 Tax=Maudiozyma exigua TaxID=34358 RepID=A0A9P6WET7_MAUEX|nr:hypothetical protein C6P45_003019 [Kazachstania exigua]